MVFSSIIFIFFFLPIFLLCYFISPKKAKNYVLLLFSLIFYAWGEPRYIIVMIISALINYLFAFKMQKKSHLIICVILNLLILCIFKYSNFVIDNINMLLNMNIGNLDIKLPIGISFFTFQAMSYTIDVYRKKVPVQRNFFKLLTYISMFPQLIAGPIVRYETIMDEMDNRTVNLDKFSNGFVRFLQGLFKKVLLANTIGLLWTKILNMPFTNMSVLTAWLGAIAFAFQIYFDFSGYSDMAIGLGKMLGFNYLENFNYPYIANSITDFWRRWHISLSTWFKDYVYIPLGGNRCSTIKHIRNILIVWLLTGFWHGASWNFIIWGLYYGILLLCEKYFLKNLLDKLPKILKHVYALLFIIIGWVIFAIDDFSLLSSYIKVMFNPFTTCFINDTFIYLFRSYFLLIVSCVVFAIPLIKFNNKKMIFKILMIVIYIVLFIVTVSFIVSDTYNPFLYFRF